MAHTIILQCSPDVVNTEAQRIACGGDHAGGCIVLLDGHPIECRLIEVIEDPQTHEMIVRLEIVAELENGNGG
jgi:hypothetical protein